MLHSIFPGRASVELQWECCAVIEDSHSQLQCWTMLEALCILPSFSRAPQGRRKLLSRGACGWSCYCEGLQVKVILLSPFLFCSLLSTWGWSFHLTKVSNREWKSSEHLASSACVEHLKNLALSKRDASIPRELLRRKEPVEHPAEVQGILLCVGKIRCSGSVV
ncbi:uncharacterized protein ACIB01_000574 [Guaruba guarouba]